MPTGRYRASVYQKYADTIEDHMANEVMKCGAIRLHWDASYKEDKHLAQHLGESMCKA